MTYLQNKCENIRYSFLCYYSFYYMNQYVTFVIIMIFQLISTIFKGVPNIILEQRQNSNSKISNTLTSISSVLLNLAPNQYKFQSY